MPNYDFLILQYNEFECLTRDLLQKREGVFVESFTSGRDGGIDLRFASVRGEHTIVQAKRYKSYSNLLGVLKQELPKVQKINPDRYIISTSMGLTPENKEEIKNLFSCFIKSTEDILGKDDLNNLLGQFPEVEKIYYKLWIGSTAVHESIVNKRIENWSGFELEKIKRDISTYVMNDSFGEALEILEKNHYVIISGIPGIGKTTLARMLVYHVLMNGYDEFININSMEDAAQLFSAGKKQVFFFDDFLGSNFFDVKEGCFERKFISFIEEIQHNPGKLFILSTREYILSEAIIHFEKFSLKNIELAKCTIELNKYTDDIRAKILYNHLAEAELPIEYVSALLNEKQYLKIIRHKNFNPRIIEAFIGNKIYINQPAAAFVSDFMAFFDHPNSVWEYAFKKLSKLAQYALYVRTTMGSGAVILSNWYEAMYTFVQGTSSQLNLELDETIWIETLKVLIGSFITTKNTKKQTVVFYQNPSVFDFLMDNIAKNARIQNYLIKNVEFIDQLYDIFADYEVKNHNCGHIKIKESQYDALESSFISCKDNLRTCKIWVARDSIIRSETNIVRFIDDMMAWYPAFIEQRQSILVNIINTSLIENSKFPLYCRMKLLDNIDDPEKYGIDLEQVTERIKEDLDSSTDYVNVMDLFDRTEKGREYLKDDEFLKQIETRLEEELDSAANEYDFDIIVDNVSALSIHIPEIDEVAWKYAIDEARNTKLSDDSIDDDFQEKIDYNNSYNDYDEMFTSLLELEK